MRMGFAQIVAIAEDTTISAQIDGALREGIPTIANVGQPPVLEELWVFLIVENVVLGLGPTYNFPSS